MKLSYIYVYFLFLISSVVFSQKTAIYTDDLADFNKAILLFKDQQYLSAAIIFDKIKSENKNQDVQSDCAYYAAIAAIHLDQANADDLIESFVRDFPTSPKQNQAFQEAGNYYFNQGNYTKSLEYSDKIEPSSMNADDLERYYFQKGYGFFIAKNKKEATTYFNKVTKSATFGSQAKYYLGFIAYESDNYKEANKQFDQVADEDKYKEKLSYFQADMNFKLGKFDKAIELGSIAMPKSSAAEKSELNKIIGESYFNLKQFDKALPYLLEYRGKKGKWSNTDYYQLGYAYYKQNNFENAISQFNKIIDGKDFVAQNGYYHLGECYLKTDKKLQSLNAFKNASEMIFDLKIQEDAAFNYAKLSYELGNSYQSVPDVLQSFLTKYAKNLNYRTIEKLLINSFISSKNYKDALVLLEKNKSPENKPAYQKVLFYRGLELYTDGNYKESLSMFKKAIAEPQDKTFSARATFWKAETEFGLDNFNEALISFKQFQSFAEAKKTAENININYNIAYCYFKLKEYDQAGNYFQTHLDAIPDDKLRGNDSYLRLADSRFVSTKYFPALEAYNKVIENKSIDADYAAYQKSICYGFLSKNDQKIDNFNQFLKVYPKSQYRDDALYELANTYVAENKTDLAVKTYDQLLSEFKNGSYNAKAILKQGLVFYNSDKDDLAIAKFKKVAAEYPNTPESIDAVATARLIYVDNGKVDEYANWVKTLGFVTVTDDELENDTYNSAEKQYLQGNSKAAQDGFVSYNAKFANGKYALKSNFYLAQLYFADNLEKNAIPNYEYVVAKSRNEFTEQSLVRLAGIFIKSNDSKTLSILKRLESEADFPQNITYAQANLMKIYYEQKDYPNAVIYSDKVLANPKTDNKIKSDAQIIVARSAIKSNDFDKAKTAYAKLQTIAKGELAAEALYYDAFFKNRESKFELSNKAVNILSKDFSGYKYFGAKGLVVMAKNFYGLKDSYQATYILNAVLENFKEYADVQDEAQKELDLIKTEEAKTNSSIIK